jgi:anti-sigma factor RsiW
MANEERDELFQLVMRYYDGELSGPEAESARVLIDGDDQARVWLADMEAMGDATFEFVREAVQREDFSEYWVTVDEGVRSPTRALREEKRTRSRDGLMVWLQRRLGNWLVPAGGLAVAGAAAVLVLAVGLPWAMNSGSGRITAEDFEGIASVDNTLEIEEIAGEQWSVSILAAGQDQPMIIWLDDLAAGEAG